MELELFSYRNSQSIVLIDYRDYAHTQKLRKSVLSIEILGPLIIS